MRRIPLLLLGLMLALTLVVAACDDDDDSSTTSAEEAYCQDVDTLTADVNSLASLDVVAEGTDGIESAVSAVQTDVDSLKDSAGDVAGDEVDALDSALSDLDDALEAAGDDLTAENSSDVVSAIENTASAAQTLETTLEASCP